MIKRARVLIDISTVWGTRRAHKTGIPRVEYEISRRFVEWGANAVVFDLKSKGFRVIPSEQFEKLIDHPNEFQLEAIVKTNRSAVNASWRHAAKMIICWIVSALQRPAEERETWVLRAIRNLARHFPSLSSGARIRWLKRLKVADTEARKQCFVHEYERVHGFDIEGELIHFQPSDVLFLLGASWGFLDLARLLEAKRSVGFTVVGLIYDLIPLRRPELLFDEKDFQRRFEEYLQKTIALSDRLTAISQFVADDINRYLIESGVPAREIVPVPLCSELNGQTSIDQPTKYMKLGLEPGRFVLMVATINPRKNHHWAYRLWKHLICEGIPAMPLVFAGQRGWLWADLFTIMERDPQLWKKHLYFVEGPTDQELAWLYANCAFTLFPSEHEGWGLPISESLAFGKYCLAADNTSLPEAGQGLAFHASTMNLPAWIEELRRLFDDPRYLEDRSNAVRRGHRTRSWDDVAGEIWAQAPTNSHMS